MKHKVTGTLHTLFFSSQLDLSELLEILSLSSTSQLSVSEETIRTSLQSEMVISKIFPDENQEKLYGDLTIKLCRLYGLQQFDPVSIAIEVDRLVWKRAEKVKGIKYNFLFRYGHFHRVVNSRVIEGNKIPDWSDEYLIDLQSRYLKCDCNLATDT